VNDGAALWPWCFALGRLMEAGLVGIVSSDARISLGFAGVLIVSGLAAAYLPARRATVIDPMSRCARTEPALIE
jgi:hypothetical protein